MQWKPVVIDAAGRFTVVFGGGSYPPYYPYGVPDTLTLLARPVTVGQHVLRWGAGGPIAATLTLHPRTGWTEPPALPAAQPAVAPGILAYVFEVSDAGPTGIGVTDGTSFREWVSTATPSATWPRLCSNGCGLIRQPRWSPDGTRLAFTASLETTPHSNVYVLDRHDGLRQLTSYGGGPPARAPGTGMGAISGRVNAESCGGPIAGITFTVVGTGISRTIGATARGTYDFTIPEVPAGRYSLNVWYATNGKCIPNATASVAVPAGGTAAVATITAVANQAEARSPAWLDDQTIVYTLRGKAYEPPGDVSALFRVRPGEEPAPLTDMATDGPVGGVDAAPGSGHLIVERFYAGISAADVAAVSATFNPVTSPAAMLPASIVDVGPAFAPDGSWIAFTRGNLLAGSPLGVTVGNLVRKDAATGRGEEQLTLYGTPPGLQTVASGVLGDPETDPHGGRPTWSPDRSQVAFTFRERSEPARIRVVNAADGSFVRDLRPVSGAYLGPGWTSGSVADYPAAPVPFEVTPPQTGTTLPGGATTTTLPGGTTTTTVPCLTPRCRMAATFEGPACAGQTIPKGIRNTVERALTKVDHLVGSRAKRAKSLVRSARRLLKNAAAAARRLGRGRRPKLSPACASAIAAAATEARGELTP
jgi:hypothetical protein